MFSGGRIALVQRGRLRWIFHPYLSDRNDAVSGVYRKFGILLFTASAREKKDDTYSHNQNGDDAEHDPKC